MRNLRFSLTRKKKSLLFTVDFLLDRKIYKNIIRAKLLLSDFSPHKKWNACGIVLNLLFSTRME